MLQIDIVKCTGMDYCKSDEEIKEYFANMYIYVLKNQIRFNQQQYGEDAIVKESRSDIFPIGIWQNRQIFDLNQAELELQDGAFKLDEITVLKHANVFSLKPTNVAPFYLEKDLIQGMWIQMNLDLTVIHREGYTVLDILSDVGGLQGILVSAFSLLLGIWNHNYLDNFIASKLFKFA